MDWYPFCGERAAAVSSLPSTLVRKQMPALLLSLCAIAVCLFYLKVTKKGPNCRAGYAENKGVLAREAAAWQGEKRATTRHPTGREPGDLKERAKCIRWADSDGSPGLAPLWKLSLVAESSGVNTCPRLSSLGENRCTINPLSKETNILF